MIFDTLENHALYAPSGSRLAVAFQFLRENDLAALPIGRVEIAGDEIFALVQEYTTKTLEQAAWEAHRAYIDLQYVVSSAERMGFANLASLEPGAYVAEKDYLSASGTANFVDVFAGAYTIFFPQDAHMPGLSVTTPQRVRKVVIKIRLEE